MRSFRSKPVGWRGESYRHYLAAKGVKTKYCASMRSKIADKLESSYSKDSVNKEILVLQEWNKGKRGKFIKEKVEEGLSFPEAVLYADDVEEAHRKQVRKDIKRRKAAKKFEDLDELSVRVAIQNVEGGLLGHNLRSMSDEELNEEKKKLEKEIEEQQQYFDSQGDNYGLENDIGVLEEFNKEIEWRKHEFFASKLPEHALGFYNRETKEIVLSKDIPEEMRDEVERHEEIHKKIHEEIGEKEGYKKFNDDVHEASKAFAWLIAADVAKKEKRKMSMKEFDKAYSVGQDILNPEEYVAYEGEKNPAAESWEYDVKMFEKQKGKPWKELWRKRDEFKERLEELRG